MNPKRDLVAKMLLSTLSVSHNSLNLRNTFTLIANSKLFKKDPSITPEYVAGVWYNHVSKYNKGDTTNKVGNKTYCFVLHSTDGSITVPNRKICKYKVPYIMYSDSAEQSVNEE